MIDVETLHNLEKKVLLALKELGEGISQKALMEKTSLGEDEINRAIEWLKAKGLIHILEDIKQRFKATELGLKYAKIGMPEKRFLKVIEKSPKTFKDVIKEANLDKNEFNAAIGFLKDENCIEIKNGLIKITDIGLLKLNSEWISEELLKELQTPKLLEEIPEGLRQAIPFLRERGLIEIDEEKIKQVYLTKEGKQILPKVKIEETIDILTPEIILNKSWKNKKFRKYDISAPAPPIFLGKKQPYLRFVDELKKKLIAFGFEEMKGPIVELAFFNNDLLFMPQDHPAREIHDIYFVKKGAGDLSKYKALLDKIEKVHEDGWETGSKGWHYPFDKKKSADIILRSHTTPVSIRKLLSKDLKIPGKYFTIDRVYRPDVIDWKHLTEFDQVEGIILGEEITFRELLGILKMFALEVGGVKKLKFVPGYFPFTEPSVELHVYMKGKGWIEIGGAGIFRPEVTLPLGIEVPVIAWGLGILRLFMTKHNVNDMRYVFSNDLRWLRNFRWENA
ncbi:MAG: phenylalanine--tRNA ligase subunit alpha [Nanoarchaeota archaeon]|nr:phenylalanine--tRNA ligase subunit alpha [Nanoarchaeota archaeon]